MDERSQNQRIDILEFINSGAAIGGELQASLEALLTQVDSGWDRNLTKAALVKKSVREGDGSRDE